MKVKSKKNLSVLFISEDSKCKIIFNRRNKDSQYQSHRLKVTDFHWKKKWNFVGIEIISGNLEKNCEKFRKKDFFSAFLLFLECFSVLSLVKPLQHLVKFPGAVICQWDKRLHNTISVDWSQIGIYSHVSLLIILVLWMSFKQ